MDTSSRRRSAHCLLLIATLLSLSACKTQAELRSAHDPSADFTRYRSFDFVSFPGVKGRGSERFAQQVERAITAEMLKRGYVIERNYPDLLVNFSSNIARSPNPGLYETGYYDYRYYRSWKGYEISDDIDAIRYARGTLNVDVVDASQMQLVWEGIAVGRIGGLSAQRDEVIPQAVSYIFTRYPFRAGEPVSAPSPEAVRSCVCDPQ